MMKFLSLVLVIGCFCCSSFAQESEVEPLRGLPAVAREPVQASSRISLREFAEFHLPEDERSEAAKKRLASLRKGVEVMRSRKQSDPTSWFFQAAVHGVADDKVIEVARGDSDVITLQREMFWNQCPHNGEPSADFLVWHHTEVDLRKDRRKSISEMSNEKRDHCHRLCLFDFVLVSNGSGCSTTL